MFLKNSHSCIIVKIDTNKTPRVELIHAFNPDSDSKFSDELKYSHLKSEYIENRKYYKNRLLDYFSLKNGRLSRQEALLQLKMQDLLNVSYRLIEADSEASRARLSRRFTNNSVKLYGQPNPLKSRYLMYQQVSELLATVHLNDHERTILENLMLDILPFDNISELQNEIQLIDFASTSLGSYFTENFKPIFVMLDELLKEVKIVTPVIAAKIFTKATTIMENYDAGWSEWKVELALNKASISVSPANKKIIVGANRVNMKPGEFKAIFLHELLIHTNRSVNGYKHNQELGLGLPEYAKAEEGLGVLAEYFAMQTTPEKILNRYIDIALAMGLITGSPINRKQLSEYVFIRENVRNRTKPISLRLEESVIKQQVADHVSRVYRGSLGNRHVGVFTKDSIYYEGLFMVARQINNDLASGTDLSQYFDFILSGKFDPTNTRHVSYVKKYIGKQKILF